MIKNASRLLYTKTSRSSSAINPQERRLRAVISELPTWKACSKPSFSSRKFHRAKSGEPYLAIIHRLDQPVEGILVFAKTPAAAKELNRQLTSQEFGKYYLAVISGIPEPQEALLKTISSKMPVQTVPQSVRKRLREQNLPDFTTEQ